jgi:cysteine desulfurase
MKRIYFDHQSTTPVLPEVFEAMRPFFFDHFGNPASLHQQGWWARDALERARKQVASLIHAESPETIIFTSGGTEAINLAVKGAAYANQRRGNHIIATAIEHPAVLHSLEFLEKQGFVCEKIAVDREGWVNPGDIARAITDQTVLICVHHVNHEMGAIEPVNEIGRLAGERGIPLFVDATASGGWLPIDVQAMGAGMLSLSPHRFYGPKGIGVLYRNRRTRVDGILHGGNQEEGRRAGTENVPAIIGAGRAAEVAQRDLGLRVEQTARLQRRIWEALKARVARISLNGPEPGPRRISTNLNFSTWGIEGEALVLRCDLNGIALASGSSCLGKAVKISPVLAALGVDHALARSSLLLTLGYENTEEEADVFVEAFVQVAEHLRSLSPEWQEFARFSLASTPGIPKSYVA